MEDIREEIRKDVDKIWDEKLKESFKNDINISFLQTLNELKKGLENFNKSVNNHIEELDKKFDEKWEKKFENEMSQIEQLKKQNNDNNNKNNDDNNKNNNLNDNNDDNDNNDNNKINNRFNNFNDDDNDDNNDFNIINNNRFKNFENDDDDDDEKPNNNKDDEENDEKLRKKEIDFNELQNPPLNYLILLPNINPLINIVLQCLSNIGYISQYYLNPVKEYKILQKSNFNPNNVYLGPSFLNLLDHLWKSNKKEYSPIEIHEVLKKLMLNNYNSNDASIIIDYILNKLHEEMNANQGNNNNEEEDPFNYYNQEFMFKKYQDNFINNKTQILENFYSTIVKAKVCSNCNSQPEYSFEGSPIINIYLEENKDENYNKLNFEEHFKSLLINKEEPLINEKCLVCDSTLQAKKTYKNIHSTSSVIIININRKKDPSNSIYFKYPEIFDGKKIINNHINLPKYELNTIIKNIKNNNKEYIAYFKSFVNKKWYSFNNQKIELIENDYKKYILDEKNVSLLIYSKIN